MTKMKILKKPTTYNYFIDFYQDGFFSYILLIHSCFMNKSILCQLYSHLIKIDSLLHHKSMEISSGDANC